MGFNQSVKIDWSKKPQEIIDYEGELSVYLMNKYHEEVWREACGMCKKIHGLCFECNNGLPDFI